MNKQLLDPESKDPLEKPFRLLSAIAVIAVVGGIIIMVISVTSSSQREVAASPKNQIAQEKIIWVKKELSQCSEAWHQKSISLTKYLTSLGIEVFDKITRENNLNEQLACQACDCASGETLYLKIHKSSLPDLPGFTQTEAP